MRSVLFRQSMRLSAPLLLLLLWYHPACKAIPVDNGVEGSPDIRCGDSSISVLFRTRNIFGGHVYVKGRYSEPGCRTDSTGLLEAGIELPFSACGVKRIRSANPAGIYVEAIVVITFHPQFITKVDRAYAIQCFYMEAQKTVSAELEVSMLTTQLYTLNVQMPVCRYEVLNGGINGPPVRYARVGDQVYHKWTCDTQTVDIFCMTVHTCFVNDGGGQRIQLLDENGCALDKYLLGNLEYTSDLMAGREAHVFKYADRPNLYFDCQVKLSVKEPHTPCQRARCTEPPEIRGRRNIMIDQLKSDEGVHVDVSAEPLTVLDIEARKSNLSDVDGSNSLIHYSDSDLGLGKQNSEELCMSKSGFGAFIVMTAAVLVCCFTVVLVLMKRATRRPATSDKE